MPSAPKKSAPKSEMGWRVHTASDLLPAIALAHKIIAEEKAAKSKSKKGGAALKKKPVAKKAKKAKKATK